MKAIRRRTGARVMSEGPHAVHSDELRRQEHGDFAKVDVRGGTSVRIVEMLTPWRRKGLTSETDMP